jgi:hypothetical protein
MSELAEVIWLLVALAPSPRRRVAADRGADGDED